MEVRYMSLAVPMRECIKCRVAAYSEYDLAQFACDKQSKYGRKNLCIVCHNKATRIYTDNNRENINKKKKKKRVEPSEKAKRAEYKLKSRYGITLDDYDSMLSSQGGCCAICKTTNPKSHGRFIVDHNHDTGKVRGLLCTSCNGALGKFGDNIYTLEVAIEYLKERGSYGKANKCLLF